MADREKVIKGLECCMKWTGEPNTATCHCSDCSYTNMDILGQRCLIDLINDALALLKEHKRITLFNEREYLVKYTGYALQLLPDVMQEVVRCKDCKHHGKDTCSAGAGIAFPPPDDFFCADGEVRE